MFDRTNCSPAPAAPFTISIHGQAIARYRAFVAAAIAWLQATHGMTPAIPSLDALWDSMSDSERDAFVDRNVPELWDAIERVTAA
jgi:hypothetical protein